MGKPRNVRNFWIELNVDGRETEIATGPVAKDGGFSMSILIRENGKISRRKVEINGFHDSQTMKNAVTVDLVDDYGEEQYFRLSTKR